MQVANATLTLNEFKATIPKNDITPAEAMLLVHMHSENAGGMPLANLTIAKAPIQRTDQEERNRLAQFYKPFSTDAKAITVEKVFPKGSKLPQTFEEITDVEGNKLFKADGSLATDPKAPAKVELVQKIKVGDKEYTAEELKTLLAINSATPLTNPPAMSTTKPV